MPDINIEVFPGTSKLLLTAGKMCNDDIVISAPAGKASGPVPAVIDPAAYSFTLEPGTSKRLLTAGKYCDRNIMVTANGVVPAGYTEIQYIQATGSAYIFLDVIPNANTNLSITFSTKSPGGCIVGCYKGWPIDVYGIWAHAVAFGNQPLLNLNLYKDGQIHTIEIINGVFYLDGEEFFRYTGDYFESPVPLGVFALNRNGNVYEINASMYLYNLEIDGTKYPLCKNADDEVGIYNPVSKVFFTNRGTKPLIPGPETGAVISGGKEIFKE